MWMSRVWNKTKLTTCIHVKTKRILNIYDGELKNCIDCFDRRLSRCSGSVGISKYFPKTIDNVYEFIKL